MRLSSGAAQGLSESESEDQCLGLSVSVVWIDVGLRLGVARREV